MNHCSAGHRALYSAGYAAARPPLPTADPLSFSPCYGSRVTLLGKRSETVPYGGFLKEGFAFPRMFNPAIPLSLHTAVPRS